VEKCGDSGGGDYDECELVILKHLAKEGYCVVG
jgi:hypothetical protein